MIAAAEFLKENAQADILSLEMSLSSSHIKSFLSLSQVISSKLLSLQTPNIKEKSLFSGQTLYALPGWIQDDEAEEKLSSKLRKNIAAVK